VYAAFQANEVVYKVPNQ